MNNACAGHKTIRIQDNHMLISTSPSCNKISNISYLSFCILSAVTIEHTVSTCTSQTSSLKKKSFFFQPNLRICGIGENKIIKSISMACGVYRFTYSCDRTKDSFRRFVVHRHDKGGAVFQGARVQRGDS